MDKTVEDIVVRLDDVLWEIDNLLNRRKQEGYTGQLVDQAIDTVLEEIKRCVNESMPKYKHIFILAEEKNEKEEK